jgi:hypothetical protein
MERIENIYGNILEYLWSRRGSNGKSREKKEQQAMMD